MTAQQRRRQEQNLNVFTVIGGRVVGNFHPSFRAEKERLASAAGLTFDEYMVQDTRQWMQSVLAPV